MFPTPGPRKGKRGMDKGVDMLLRAWSRVPILGTTLVRVSCCALLRAPSRVPLWGTAQLTFQTIVTKQPVGLLAFVHRQILYCILYNEIGLSQAAGQLYCILYNRYLFFCRNRHSNRLSLWFLLYRMQPICFNRALPILSVVRNTLGAFIGLRDTPHL